MTYRPSPEQERRKRRRELLVALAATVLVVLIFWTESYYARSHEDTQFAGHLLIFFLLSVVTLLLILVIFFLIRNLFKLVFERRRKVLGSHLQTRLTLAFVALTLVPTVVLFIVSAGVLHTKIETFFTTQVEDSLEKSEAVAQIYYDSASDKVKRAAFRLAALIEAKRLLDAPGLVAELQSSLDSWRKSEGLSSIEIYRNGNPPVLVRGSSIEGLEIPEAIKSFLNIAYQGERSSTIVPLGAGGELVRGIAPIRDGPAGEIRYALVADYHVATALSAPLEFIAKAKGDFLEAKRMKGSVKTIYILILLMVALLVIFIGFWIGISIARDITDPILSLAEGTEKIAAGNLDVYIEPVADDELGVLVRSFNKMAADLRTNRDELIRVNLDLESRRTYMESVLKNIAAGVLSVDSVGMVTTTNNSAGRLLGIGEKDVLGKPLGDVLPEASAAPVREALDALKESDTGAVERQMTISFPDKLLTLICFANSLHDEEGRDLGVVLVLEDMTYLVKAQRMAAWREVARRVAHEIKNPLTPIQLSAQRMRRKYTKVLGADAEVLDECTGTIIDQVEQLKTMVNEFSKFARMPAANPVPNDLNALTADVMRLYVQGNDGAPISFEPDAQVPVFDLDKEQIKRVLVNLVDNALAATGKNGNVRVRTAYDPILSIASIEVADDGAGIDPRDRERLFEPYFSRKPGGTGLGLTIVSTIVSDHNGFIRVKDNSGRGTCFIVELPVRKK